MHGKKRWKRNRDRRLADGITTTVSLLCLLNLEILSTSCFHVTSVSVGTLYVPKREKNHLRCEPIFSQEYYEILSYMTLGWARFNGYPLFCFPLLFAAFYDETWMTPKFQRSTKTQHSTGTTGFNALIIFSNPSELFYFFFFFFTALTLPQQ